MLGDEPNQSFSASRDDHVENTIKTNHHQRRLSIRGGQKGDSLGRQAFVRQRLSENLGDRRVAVKRLFAASKQDRVAALEAKGGSVCRHVRPGFIDDADEAQGRAHLSDAKTVVEHALLDDRAHGIREPSNLFEAVSHSAETLPIELKAIEHRLRQPHLLGGRHVLCVRLEHAIARLPAQGFSRPAQHGVLLLGARRRKDARGFFGSLSQARHERGQVITHRP